MGILNLTPDSFWEPSRWNMSMLESGADIIDIGAVSTRPGAGDVPLEEEWRRLAPVLNAVPGGLRISIDTTRAEIVRRAYETMGPFIVNDISAGEDDPGMLPLVGRLGLRYVAMHKRGGPRTMDGLCDYGNVVEDVLDYFRRFERMALENGIGEWILDPGFGFAKTSEQNIELLRSLGSFKVFGRPVLAGIADKRFTAGRTEYWHLEALRAGADILRVHDVAAARKTVEEYMNSIR